MLVFISWTRTRTSLFNHTQSSNEKHDQYGREAVNNPIGGLERSQSLESIDSREGIHQHCVRNGYERNGAAVVQSIGWIGAETSRFHCRVIGEPTTMQLFLDSYPYIGRGCIPDICIIGVFSQSHKPECGPKYHRDNGVDDECPVENSKANGDMILLNDRPDGNYKGNHVQDAYSEAD